MNWTVGFLQKWWQPQRAVLSIHLREDSSPWVMGLAIDRGCLHFDRVLEVGVTPSNPQLFANGGLVAEDGLMALMEATLNALHASSKVAPKSVVFVLPAQQCFLGQVTVGLEDSEEDIQFQVEDMLDEVMGYDAEPMTYDWQQRSASTTYAERQLAVAAMHQKQLEVFERVCHQKGLSCLGITLDHVAALNACQRAGLGRTDASKDDSRFVLYGELNPHSVRLVVFVEGMPFGEHWERSEEGFSPLQAVTALEGLVNGWGRSVPEFEGQGLGLHLSGALLEQASTLQIVQRSPSLSTWAVPLSKPAHLPDPPQAWLAPWGAVEGLPCS